MIAVRSLFLVAAIATFALSPNAFCAPGVAADVSYMARLVFAAVRDGRDFPDFYRINPSLSDDQLYAVQQQFVARQLAGDNRIIGFKGGFIPRAPVAGVLLGAGQLENNSRISLHDFRLLIVEAEVAFRFCAAVKAPLHDIQDLKNHVCELAPALEIADGAIADFADVKADFTHMRQALIPLNVAYSHVLIGAPVAAAGVDLRNLAVGMRHDDVVLGERNPEAQQDLWANVLWVVNEFVLKRGYSVAVGQYIIPGNLTGIHVGQTGRYHADFAALGSVDLLVEP